MQQRPTPFVLPIFFVLTIITALGWLGAQYVGSPLTLISPSDSLAMGRGPGIPLPDDSLPETLTPHYNSSLQGSAIWFMGGMMAVMGGTGGNQGLMNAVMMISSTYVPFAATNGKPYVLIVVQAPKDGWYIVNCVANGAGAQASFTTFGPNPVNVASWDYRNRPHGNHLYPALVELKAGTHYFYWTLLETVGYIFFLETHILKVKI